LQTYISPDLFLFFEFFITYSVQKLKIHEENQREIGFKGKWTCQIFDIPGESLDYDLADRAPRTLNSLSFSSLFFSNWDYFFNSYSIHKAWLN